jgi:undecaprenyl-diphosphatase
MMSDVVKAVILGIIEGITEFLPVSSTGHMLLAQQFFGLGEGAFWQSFVVLIQLGAILAIVMLYFTKLWRVALGMFSNADDRRFVIGVLLAFLPAVIIGLLGGKYIKEYLFNSWVVCFTLIAGGAILLWVDQLDRVRCDPVPAADVPLDRHRAMRCDDSRRVAFRRQHRGGDAARRRQAVVG